MALDWCAAELEWTVFGVGNTWLTIGSALWITVTNDCGLLSKLWYRFTGQEHIIGCRCRKYALSLWWTINVLFNVFYWNVSSFIHLTISLSSSATAFQTKLECCTRNWQLNSRPLRLLSTWSSISLEQLVGPCYIRTGLCTCSPVHCYVACWNAVRMMLDLLRESCTLNIEWNHKKSVYVNCLPSNNAKYVARVFPRIKLIVSDWNM